MKGIVTMDYPHNSKPPGTKPPPSVDCPFCPSFGSYFSFELAIDWIKMAFGVSKAMS
jgi:hypothetical protein